MPIPKAVDKYTVQDYMTWPDEERWEIIDGVAYDMSPAPSVIHQEIVLSFGSFFKQHLKDKSCRPFISPIDVILSEYDVVQPDVFVVCDPEKITEKNIQGAPDLVIEILSPSTSTKDQREKFSLYERHGVREYLVIEPEAKNVRRYLLNEEDQFGSYKLFDAQQTIKLQSLEELEVPLWEIFGVERIEEDSKESKV